jgi:hypothetical protein
MFFDSNNFKKGVLMTLSIHYLNKQKYFYCYLIYFFFILIGSSISLLCAQNGYCTQVTLAWDPNTEPDLAGYKLYYGTLSRNYSEIIDVGNVTNYTAYKLNSGLTYYFAVTAYDPSGYESDYSNEVDKTIIQQYTLTTKKNGIGSGTIISSPEGINCGTDCTETYNAGAVVTLTATPDSASTFSIWAGSGCAGNGQCSFSINANTRVTANFTNVTSTSVTVISPNISEGIPSGSIYQTYWLVSPVVGYDESGTKIGEDISDTPFIIEVVKLKSPNGGNTLTSGKQYTIRWTTNATRYAVAKVKLYYTKNGTTWHFIKTIMGSNPESFKWIVPTVSIQKTKCKVKVQLFDVFGKSVGRDISNRYFTIQPSL